MNIIRMLFIGSLFLLIAMGPNPRTGGSRDTASPVDAEKSVNSKAPDFSLKDAYGKSLSLSSLKGEVVLVNFWATWCGPCKIEIPWFIEFEQQFRDRGLAALGVSMDEDGWSAVKPYVASNKINYRMDIGDDMTAQKYGGVELIRRYGRVHPVNRELTSPSRLSCFYSMSAMLRRMSGVTFLASLI